MEKVPSSESVRVSSSEDSAFMDNCLSESPSKASHISESSPGSLSGMYCLQQPVTFKVTPEGGVFPDPAKKDQQQCMGASIEVPEGAILPNTTVAFEVTVCVKIGPIDYPEDTIPISPVLKLHPKPISFELLKPINISLPHVLSDEVELENDDNLGVMKAVGGNKFEKLDCKITLENIDGHTIAVFSVEHFCYLQLYAKREACASRRIRYCICPVLPDIKEMPFDEPFMLYFCITYKLKDFLEAINKQCEKIEKLKKYKYKLDVDKGQKFLLGENSDGISAECTRPTEGSGWRWNHFINGCGTGAKITALAVQPWNDAQAEFEYDAENFLYPPSFKLEVCCSKDRKEDQVTVTFTGDTEPTLEEITLLLPPASDRSETPLSPATARSKTATSATHDCIRNNMTRLVPGVGWNLQEIADKLFEVHVISGEILPKLRNENHTQFDRARIIVDHMLEATAEQVDTFLTIVCEKSGLRKDTFTNRHMESTEATASITQADPPVDVQAQTYSTDHEPSLNSEPKQQSCTARATEPQPVDPGPQTVVDNAPEENLKHQISSTENGTRNSEAIDLGQPVASSSEEPPKGQKDVSDKTEDKPTSKNCVII